MRTMAEEQVYYKWKNTILPDEKSIKTENKPERIVMISAWTFTDFDVCVKTGRKQDYNFPDSFQGPYLSIIGGKDKQALQAAYENSLKGKVDDSNDNFYEKQIDMIPVTSNSYFKWQFAFLAGPPWKEPVYFELGKKTFNHIGQCIADSIDADLNVPGAWRGYYLQILESRNKEVLEDVYHKNKRRELTSFGDEITIWPMYSMDQTLDFLKKMCPNVKV